MTTVLITGAGGLIGARVAEAAGKAGYSVTRILHKAPPTENMLERDLRIPLENVPPCDWVFHLAYTTLPKTSNDDPVYDVRSNLIDTIQLLKE